MIDAIIGVAQGVGATAFSLLLVLLLVLYGVWRFLDKWAGKFFEVQKKEAEAMTTLAETLRASTDDSRESLIVMRALSHQNDDMADQLREQGKQLALLKGLIEGLKRGN